MQSQKLVNLLSSKKLKIATAESCTGGLLAKNITDTSGASAVFDMGIVSYANEIKNNVFEYFPTLKKGDSFEPFISADKLIGNVFLKFSSALEYEEKIKSIKHLIKILPKE